MTSWILVSRPRASIHQVINHGWPSTQPGSLHTALQRKYTQPCSLFSRGTAVWTMGARLCEQWGHGCVNNGARLCASARLCRGSPVSMFHRQIWRSLQVVRTFKAVFGRWAAMEHRTPPPATWTPRHETTTLGVASLCPRQSSCIILTSMCVMASQFTGNATGCSSAF